MASALPRLRAVDSSPALLVDGYRFIPRRCRRHRTDAFVTRILGEKVVCMTGPDAARLFYGTGRFTRKRGIPRPTLTLLQDFGSAAVLDGAAHHHRKRMFVDLLAPDAVARHAELFARELRAAGDDWGATGDVVVDAAMARALCRAVCAWTGVPLPPQDTRRRAADLAALFDGAGAAGPRQVRGQLARRRSEAWAQSLVDDARSGRLELDEGTPLHVLACHRGLDGELLTKEVAGVELLNILRPTVAVMRFITFAALALHQHPEWRERLASGEDDGDVHRFVQEVRRVAPFFPLISGRTKEAFSWNGHDFAEGDWAMLDLYGTNRDARAWDRPDAFEPDRFRDWDGDPFTLVPQGGGDVREDHRCPGEKLTIALMEVAVRFLTREVDYEVPEQDLHVALWRMPALPRSGFVIRGVRRRERPR
jgi:fatty-acid peroxygenase